jgi:hypothetical protein
LRLRAVIPGDFFPSRQTWRLREASSFVSLDPILQSLPINQIPVMKNRNLNLQNGLIVIACLFGALAARATTCTNVLFSASQTLTVVSSNGHDPERRLPVHLSFGRILSPRWRATAGPLLGIGANITFKRAEGRPFELGSVMGNLLPKRRAHDERAVRRHGAKVASASPGGRHHRHCRQLRCPRRQTREGILLAAPHTLVSLQPQPCKSTNHELLIT